MPFEPIEEQIDEDPAPPNLEMQQSLPIERRESETGVGSQNSQVKPGLPITRKSTLIQAEILEQAKVQSRISEKFQKVFTKNLK